MSNDTAAIPTAVKGSDAFMDAVLIRRSIYKLNKTLPVPQEKVVELVKEAIKHCPSSFNSRSTRAVVLLNAEHERFWAHTRSCLAAIVPEGSFSGTAAKMDAFSAAAGTVLFFEDQDVVKKLQESFPLYADAFPMFSEHTAGIHHFTVWTALATEGIGGNLQHYSPLVDAGVREMWGVPESWALKAQLVFGGIVEGAGKKEFGDVEERVKVFGL